MSKRLFLILWAGLALRIAAVSFGLPHLYHADEPIVVNHALAYGAGDLNPHFFNIPPLTSYLLFFCYGIYFIAGAFAGWFHSVQDFEKLFYTDPTNFYLIARITLGALLGTASIIVLHKAVKKHFTTLLADITAFLFAIYFLHVRDSHYIYADIPLIFAMLASFGCILNVMEAPTVKNCFWTGVWIGIATASKYNGAVLWAPFLFALISVHPQEFSKKIFFALFGCGAAFLALNPYALMDSSFFLKELAEQGKSQNGVGWLHHFQYSLVNSAGLPMLAAALSGIFLAYRNNDLKRRMFAFFFFIYYAVLALKGQPYDRYALPLVPVCAFFAADFILTAASSPKGLRKSVLVLLIAGVAIPSLTRCYLWLDVMRAPDVRTEAEVWIEQNIPSGENIAMDWDFFMPRLHMSPAQLDEKKAAAEKNPDFSKIQLRRLDLMKEMSASGASYNLYSFSETPKSQSQGFLLEKPRVAYDLAQLKAGGIHYAIVSQYAHPESGSFYEILAKQGRLVAEFNPYRGPLPESSLDDQPLTGGPFLLKDLKARKSSGRPLQVYKIQ